MMMLFDLILLAVLAAGIFWGYWKGLAWQIAAVAAIIISYFVAMQFRYPVARLISVDEPWNVFAAMALLYLVTSLAVWIAFGFVKESIVKMHLKDFDRQAGAILGGLKGILTCMVITMFAVTILGERARYQVVSSKSGRFVANAINQVTVFVPNELHEVLDPVFKNFNEKMNEPVSEFANGARLFPNEAPIPSDTVPGRRATSENGLNLETLVDKGIDLLRQLRDDDQPTTTTPPKPNSGIPVGYPR